MELLVHYRQLAGYDRWANLEMIASFRAAASTPPRALRWLAHIVGAEFLWRARILQQESPFPVWPEFTLEQCEKEIREIAALWRQFLADRSEQSLEELVAYKNSKGEAYRSTVRDILTHVFMHSAYHRGQIAAEMRQAGNVPAYTDFIHGVRQGLIE